MLFEYDAFFLPVSLALAFFRFVAAFSPLLKFLRTDFGKYRESPFLPA